MCWLEEGKDLNAWMPYLSAYMGHDNFKATFYYINMLPERLANTAFTCLDGILPEVRYEEHMSVRRLAKGSKILLLQISTTKP
jgi:hypothetical protein